MTALAPAVRGWCPGALRPMESGDGLIVRIRPRCGALSPSPTPRAIADIAARTGNGLIDLTRRANVQMRGLAPERLAAAVGRSVRRGISSTTSAEAEAVRNVMVSPLAGLDPAETTDVRAVGRQIWSTRWPPNRRCGGCRAKFSFIVDGGGAAAARRGARRHPT